MDGNTDFPSEITREFAFDSPFMASGELPAEDPDLLHRWDLPGPPIEQFLVNSKCNQQVPMSSAELRHMGRAACNLLP